MTINKQHISECATALECWTSRRSGQIKGKTISKQNIWQVVCRIISLFNCIEYMENKLNVDFSEYKILDVGSASGYGLTPFLLAGFTVDQLYGIDLFEDRIKLGRDRLPGLNLYVGDATEMKEFNDGQFDMVMEQFCFCHITNDAIIERIAKEMLRCVKPHGYILVRDWIFGSKKRHYNGVPLSKIKRMFGVGDKTRLIKVFPSKLFPPIGGFLSRKAPQLYPLVQLILPFLVLSKLTLLQRMK